MANGIEMKDLYFLNPNIDTNCTNLCLGYSYCILPVGNIATYPGYSTPTNGWSPTMTAPWTSITDFLTGRPWTPIVTPITAPLAKRTWKDCVEYQDNFMGDVPCSWLTNKVSEIHFAMWNPLVNWWDCILANNTRYCTLYAEAFISPDYYNDGKDEPEYDEAPQNAATESTRKCYEWYSVVEGKLLSLNGP
ncbi:hypothetical protein BJX62DRAFT_233084 [Aspergillus germanicus]